MAVIPHRLQELAMGAPGLTLTIASWGASLFPLFGIVANMALPKTAAEAQDAWDRWQQAWEDAVAPLGLPPGSTPRVVSAYLAELDEYEHRRSAAARASDDYQRHRRRVDNFAEQVISLAESCGYVKDKADVYETARRLREKLDTAHLAQQRRADLIARQTKLTHTRDTAQREHTVASSAITRLLAEASCADDAALLEAIQRSNRVRVFDEQIEQHEQDLREQAGDWPLDELIARTESMEMPTMSARLSQLGPEIDQVFVSRSG